MGVDLCGRLEVVVLPLLSRPWFRTPSKLMRSRLLDITLLTDWSEFVDLCFGSEYDMYVSVSRRDFSLPNSLLGNANVVRQEAESVRLQMY